MKCVNTKYFKSFSDSVPKAVKISSDNLPREKTFCKHNNFCFKYPENKMFRAFLYSLCHCSSTSSVSTQIKPLSASQNVIYVTGIPKMENVQGLEHCRPPQCFLIEELFLMPNISHDLSYFLFRSLSLSKIIHFLRPEIEKYVI